MQFHAMIVYNQYYMRLAFSHMRVHIRTRVRTP